MRVRVRWCKVVHVRVLKAVESRRTTGSLSVATRNGQCSSTKACSSMLFSHCHTFDMTSSNRSPLSLMDVAHIDRPNQGAHTAIAMDSMRVPELPAAIEHQPRGHRLTQSTPQRLACRQHGDHVSRHFETHRG